MHATVLPCSSPKEDKDPLSKALSRSQSSKQTKVRQDYLIALNRRSFAALKYYPHHTSPWDRETPNQSLRRSQKAPKQSRGQRLSRKRRAAVPCINRTARTVTIGVLSFVQTFRTDPRGVDLCPASKRRMMIRADAPSSTHSIMCTHNRLTAPTTCPK